MYTANTIIQVDFLYFCNTAYFLLNERLILCSISKSITLLFQTVVLLLLTMETSTYHLVRCLEMLLLSVVALDMTLLAILHLFVKILDGLEHLSVSSKV